MAPIVLDQRTEEMSQLGTVNSSSNWPSTWTHRLPLAALGMLSVLLLALSFEGQAVPDVIQVGCPVFHPGMRSLTYPTCDANFT